MDVREFEGKNEQEAIDNAIESLGLNREDIDVEIVESKKASFLFGGGKVKIRVHMEEDKDFIDDLEPENEFEQEMVDFLEGLVEQIGLDAQVRITFRKEGKLGFDIDTDDSGIIIGKRGQTLEAIQLITNIVAGKHRDTKKRIIVDSEQYRVRRERNLVHFAEQAADQVRRNGGSRLLESMNPFERRLIHTALSHMEGIDTNSEGEGLYKRIRIRSQSGGRQPHTNYR